MNNSDMPFMPTSPNSSDPEWAAARIGGLTKREYFSCLAMQGMIASDVKDTPEAIVRCSVMLADALLKELENE